MHTRCAFCVPVEYFEATDIFSQSYDWRYINSFVKNNNFYLGKSVTRNVDIRLNNGAWVENCLEKYTFPSSHSNRALMAQCDFPSFTERQRETCLPEHHFCIHDQLAAILIDFGPKSSQLIIIGLDQRRINHLSVGNRSESFSFLFWSAGINWVLLNLATGRNQFQRMLNIFGLDQFCSVCWMLFCH